MYIHIHISQYGSDHPIEVQIEERGRNAIDPVRAKATLPSEEEIIPFLNDQLAHVLYQDREHAVEDVGVPFTVHDHVGLAVTDLKEVVGPRVYFVQGGDDGPIRIGHTASISTTFRTMQTNSPVELKVLLVMTGSSQDAHGCHVMFRRDRLHGKWFKASSRLLAFIERMSSGVPLSLREAAEIEKQDRPED